MRAKRRAAAIVLAALLAAAAACGAQGIALTVKVFPQNAELAVDGALVGSQARLGSPPRVLSLAAGDHAIRLTAAGYQPRELTVALRSPLTLEVKLEREGSRLVKRFDVPTGRQPKSVAFTPDGMFILCALLEGEGVEAIPADGTAGRLTLAPPAPWATKKGFVEMAFLADRRLLAEGPPRLTGRKDGLCFQLGVEGRFGDRHCRSGGDRALFVSSRGPNNPADYTKKGPAFGTISCIDTETRAVVDWTWGRNQPTGLAVSPDGRRIAFTNFLDNEIEVYDFARDESVQPRDVRPRVHRCRLRGGSRASRRAAEHHPIADWCFPKRRSTRRAPPPSNPYADALSSGYP